MVLVLLVGRGIWLKKNPPLSSNSPPKLNDNSQKILTLEIKTELEQIKKAKTTNDIDETLVFGCKVRHHKIGKLEDLIIIKLEN